MNGEPLPPYGQMRTVANPAQLLARSRCGMRRPLTWSEATFRRYASYGSCSNSAPVKRRSDSAAIRGVLSQKAIADVADVPVRDVTRAAIALDREMVD